MSAGILSPSTCTNVHVHCIMHVSSVWSDLVPNCLKKFPTDATSLNSSFYVSYKITHISAVINFILFFFYSILLRIMLFDMVPSSLLLGTWKPRYESLCSYTPLIFLYFLLISHVFINIHENLNLMCCELDHLGKHVVSMH